jgi:Zn-dependent peptidase ImmA (M78 family)
MENFNIDDIITYQELNLFIKNKKVKNLLNINYLNENLKQIDIPNKLFSYKIFHKRKDLIKYFPFNIFVKNLERGTNRWLQKTNYLGIYSSEKKELSLHLDINHKYSEIELLWILMHEFRHHVQYQNKNIESCINNKNVDKWIEYYKVDKNKIFHTFHEILPFEVDANIFASEILNINYPGSKFNITDETLKLLE